MGEGIPIYFFVFLGRTRVGPSALTGDPEIFTQMRHLSKRLHSDRLVQVVTTCSLKKPYNYMVGSMKLFPLLFSPSFPFLHFPAFPLFSYKETFHSLMTQINS